MTTQADRHTSCVVCGAPFRLGAAYNRMYCDDHQAARQLERVRSVGRRARAAETPEQRARRLAVSRLYHAGVVAGVAVKAPGVQFTIRQEFVTAAPGQVTVTPVAEFGPLFYGEALVKLSELLQHGWGGNDGYRLVVTATPPAGEP